MICALPDCYAEVPQRQFGRRRIYCSPRCQKRANWGREPTLDDPTPARVREACGDPNCFCKNPARGAAWWRRVQA